MSAFTDGLGLVLAAVGVGTAVVGAVQQSNALEDQASQIENLSGEEKAFIEEQALIEADLIASQGLDEQQVLEFNRNVALSNAEYERRSGEVALNQSQRRWESQISSVTANFAASGARLTGTTNDVILEQVNEAEKDFFNIGLNTARAVAAQEDQASFFSLQKDQIAASTKRKTEARLRIGLLESNAVGTTAAARAGAARTSSTSALLSGFGSAARQGGSLLGDFGLAQERADNRAGVL